jgi:hypothetical protein
MQASLFGLFFAVLVGSSSAFYLPGVAPMDFRKASCLD